MSDNSWKASTPIPTGLWAPKSMGLGVICEIAVTDSNGAVICRCACDDSNRDKAVHQMALVAAAPRIKSALQELLAMYLALANSGDAGFWDPEKEDEVIAARAALAGLETKP